MKKILLGIILSVGLFSFGNCQEPVQPLQLTIKPDKEVYKANEEIIITATLENLSEKEMVVFWNNEKPSLRTEESGGVTIYMPEFPADNIETLYIKPEKSIENDIVIASSLLIDKTISGKVILTLQYNYPSLRLDFLAAPDQELFTGALISNPITVEVAQKKDISKEEALEIAKEVCKKEGWVWKDSYIELQEDKWWVVGTNSTVDGGNAVIIIDKNNGEVVDKLYPDE